MNSLRIINVDNSNLDNLQSLIYIFKKNNFRIDTFKMISGKKTDNIKYAKNNYYDVNIFIDEIVPIEKNKNSIYFKEIFPAKINIFIPKLYSFYQYNMIKYIDIVLCKSSLCYDFIKFIKEEKGYNYKYYNMMYIHAIPKELRLNKYNKKNPNIFLYIALDTNCNMSSLLYCWLKNDCFRAIDSQIELHLISNEKVFTDTLYELSMTFNYNIIFKIENIIKYKNITIYIKKLDNSTFSNVVARANVAFDINKKPEYTYYNYIYNYYNISQISINRDMTKIDNDNLTLIQKDTWKIKQYDDSKYKFTIYNVNIDELKNKIIYCIKNKHIIVNKLIHLRTEYRQERQKFKQSVENIIKENIIPNIQGTRSIQTKYYSNINTINASIYNTMINTDEAKCIYVSSHGIMKSCNVYSCYNNNNNELVGYDETKLFENCSIYVSNNAINKFAKQIKNIKYKFYLVSGDSDLTCPTDLFDSDKDFIDFIESDKIIHWYSQNCISLHKKITSIPIGMDYHTLAKTTKHATGNMMSATEQEKNLITIKNKSQPFWDRIIKCYINFSFTWKDAKFGYDRYNAMKMIPSNLTIIENKFVTRDITHNNMIKYSFIISPLGNGLDCHRTWEGLILGCIVIVKTSPLDILYEDLPVLIVKDWNEINIKLLEDTIIKFKNTKFNYDRLLLKYWSNKFTYK